MEDCIFENNEVEKFDTIIASNVIEHMSNPYITLKMLSDQHIDQNGHIVIVVPDISLALMVGRIRRILRHPDPYGVESGNDSGTIAFNSPGHLFFFARKTLAMLCQRLGWNVVAQRHAPYVFCGTESQSIKDKIKPWIYRFMRLGERIGIGNVLSYSQLLIARKNG